MTLSMHAVAAPMFRHILIALDGVLDIAKAHAAREGIDESVLIEARLAPDMFALARQVQIATDFAKGAVTRLAGREPPTFADDETSFDALKARIARTLEIVAGVSAEEMEGAKTRHIVIAAGQRMVEFDGQSYLLHFALPNFYFHAATAYDILRAQGVAIGKRDFLGTPEGGVPAWLRAG